MIQLNLPKEFEDYSKIIKDCCGNRYKYRQHILDAEETLLREGEKYKEQAKLNNLFCFDKAIPKSEFILGSLRLKNSHIIELYSDRLCRYRAGDVYDKLINLAKNPKIGCPFCGGINIPAQIDHFLPKSRYGVFSVYPYNLIPICIECNTIYKKEFFPTTREKQLIHPYLDSDCYFKEQWLYAEYIIDDGSKYGTISYFVNPPDKWDSDKKEKIKFHFDKFKLDQRFAQKSVEIISDLLTQMESYKHEDILSMEDFKKCSIDSLAKGISSINHWKKVALMAIRAKISVIWNNL